MTEQAEGHETQREDPPTGAEGQERALGEMRDLGEQPTNSQSDADGSEGRAPPRQQGPFLGQERAARGVTELRIPLSQGFHRSGCLSPSTAAAAERSTCSSCPTKAGRLGIEARF